MPEAARPPRSSAARNVAATVALYGRSAARIVPRARASVPSSPRGRTEERLVFVVGSPRSGTTFSAAAIGAQPPFVDLGEVRPVKAAIEELAALPLPGAAARFRAILERVRALGLARRLRAVEQTPETAFVLAAALAAYPEALAVHVVRDGRDVVCSLLERGWLNSGRAGRDDAKLALGAHRRFWVEPERAGEFAAASDATRAAWAWRRYVGAARAAAGNGGRTHELRYEQMAADPGEAAAGLAERLGVEPGTLGAALARAHGRSVGRWQRDLTAEQLADVEREAGPLLRELGYA